MVDSLKRDRWLCQSDSRLVSNWIKKEVKWRRNEFFGITLKLCCFAMYRIHQHKLVVVQIETHKSYIKMNNNNNQLKDICWRGVFFSFTIWVLLFFFLDWMKWNKLRGEANETNQTNESVRKEGESQGNERKIEPRRGDDLNLIQADIYIFFWENQYIYIYTEQIKRSKGIYLREREKERESIRILRDFPPIFVVG